MSLTNISRDGIHVLPQRGKYAPSNEVTLISNTLQVNADPAVYSDIASAKLAHNTMALTAQNWKAIGCYMKQPNEDKTPFRVKASCLDGFEPALVIGYAPAIITGTDDLIYKLTSIPFHQNLDEIIMLDPVDADHGDGGKAICFALALTSTVSDKRLLGTLSVQNLGISPPPHAKGIS